MAKFDLNSILFRLYGWMWTLIVSLLVTAAVVLTLVRMALPYTETYRADVEQTLSKALGQRVTIGNMTAELVGLSPTLVLEGLTIYGPQGQRPQFQLARMGIGFSVRKSLQEMKAVPISLQLAGTELKVVRNKQNQLSINGLLLARPQGTEVKGSGLGTELNWLFGNARLRIEQVSLDYDDRILKQHLLLDQLRLKLRNSGSRHQIDGDVVLPGNWARSAGFSLDIDAEQMFQPSSWKISSFVVADGVDVANILASLAPNARLKAQGTVGLRLWSQWQGLEPQGFFGDVALNGLAVNAADSEQRFEAESATGRFRIERDAATQWTLDVERLQLNDRIISREASRIRLAHDTVTGHSELKANLLYLQDLRQWLLLSGALSEEQGQMLDQLAVAGELHDLQLNLQPQKNHRYHYDLAFRAQEVSNRAYGKLPRIDGLSAVVWMDEQSGAARLESQHLQLELQPMFRQSWPLRTVQGLLQWRRHQGNWYLQSERLGIDSPNGRLQARLQLILPNEQQPGYLDLLAQIDELQVTALPGLYPVSIMKPQLVEWLDRSLQAGQVRQGGVVYRGWLRGGGFPFRQQQGKFEVDLNATELQLAYQPEWPALREMDADFVFAGAGMEARTRSATTEGMTVHSLSAVIEEFHEPWLRLQGEISGATPQAIQFLEQSPLHHSFEPLVGRLHTSGQSALQLSMDIPLNKALGSMSYRGELAISNSQIHSDVGDSRIQAEAINGKLVFTEQGYSSAPFTARVFSQPASVIVATTNNEAGRTVELLLEGHASATQLQRELKLSPLAFIKGESDFSARLQIHQGQQQGPELLVSSQLQGMSIELPAPLLKSPEELRALQARWDFRSQQLQLAIGDKLHSVFWLDNTQPKPLRRGTVHLGPESAQLPDSDVLRLSGRLEQFPLAQWLKRVSSDGSGTGLTGELPWELALDYLQVMPLGDAGAQAAKANNGMQNGQLPKLRMDIGKLVYGELDLGHVLLDAKPMDGSYRIDELSAKGSLLNFSSQGYWQRGSRPQSSLRVQLQARDTEQLLTALKYDSPIRGGRLDISGDLSWPGSPTDFELKAVEGNLLFNIKDGRLENIEPGAGRILGLLSFQALPRRLALDFRDLFGTGYRFDSIHGEFNISEGNALTRNMTILSPAARVYISGRTGLAARDYDQDVIVVLGDGSNYFVAGALAGGLQTGVVVWVVEKLLNVEHYSRLIYKITGTWEHPVVTSINEAADSATAPAEP